ncbi:ADP-ribosyl cyclase/cyclic ADP-ribose hydrolase 1-like [Fundulus heteroclitus]|uniref:ADP-ribosyl cyclase/cyclic ADP-ribose hydrolase 1-like n=1 Tax=Fundulus heteroclitus TaxID=8078 RepID=UPI00165A5346|nr:ADP-ribosyl cyclase/cyclic ADP-ribose hydrolase 1-like [Fundulus heteroclitus]
MECGRRIVIIAVIATVLVVVIICIAICTGIPTPLAVTPSQTDDDFKDTFMERCQKFNGSKPSRANCQTIWDKFQQAYVNKDPCEVPTEAYDPVIAEAPMESAHYRFMFWSKTKDVVHEFTGKNNCFMTLEKFLLGSVLDDLVWCGKKGSNETFTTGCPNGTECVKNPVRSFWNRSSAAFAELAWGNVTVMLNGSLQTPFDNESIFASVELKRFEFPRVTHLAVVLVTQKNSETNCSNESLQKLKKEVLDKGIGYNCSAVTESHLKACASDTVKLSHWRFFTITSTILFFSFYQT